MTTQGQDRISALKNATPEKLYRLKNHVHTSDDLTLNNSLVPTRNCLSISAVMSNSDSRCHVSFLTFSPMTNAEARSLGTFATGCITLARG